MGKVPDALICPLFPIFFLAVQDKDPRVRGCSFGLFVAPSAVLVRFLLGKVPQPATYAVRDGSGGHMLP